MNELEQAGHILHHVVMQLEKDWISGNNTNQIALIAELYKIQSCISQAEKDMTFTDALGKESE